MKKISILTVGVLTLFLPLSACANEPAAIDTGIHSIEVPADAVVTQKGIEDGINGYQADLPDWEFEDAVAWMRDRLPVGEHFDGMNYIEEKSGGDEYTESWYWSGISRTDECHVLAVAVIDGDMGDPANIIIADGVADDDVCE